MQTASRLPMGRPFYVYGTPSRDFCMAAALRYLVGRNHMLRFE
jgi:hypothetical protein